jgi:hypothetical protein
LDPRIEIFFFHKVVVVVIVDVRVQLLRMDHLCNKKVRTHLSCRLMYLCIYIQT